MDFFPGYRYCGPGKSGPGAPVNQLDAICMEHDACYSHRGFNRQNCDLIFLDRIKPYTRQNTKMGKDAALMYWAIRLKLFL